MHAIDSPGSVNGRFSEGNPAIGQRATKVGGDWLNDLQDNVLGVLAEGGVAPVKGRSEDLADAIKSIAEGIVGSGDGSVPTTRKLLGGGLVVVSGSGDLSANRTIEVKKSTASSVRQGTADDEALTPLALAEALGGTIGQAGSLNLFGALTLKWGAVRGNYSEGSVYTAFPQPFATACWIVLPVGVNAAAADERNVFVQLINRTKDGFTSYIQRTYDAQNHLDGFDWIALGK